MSSPVKTQRLASLSPAWVTRRLMALAERFLPLRWMDEINHFVVQTRLIFSKFILLLVAALFFFFSWATIARKTYREDDTLGFLMMLSLALGVILHMSLWESEREERTFEFLVMRVPSTHRLIWFKMRVSLLWGLVLFFPFFLGLVWFVSIPLGHALVYFLFSLTYLVFASMFTCVVSSFVHRALPTGIISIIVIVMFFGFLSNPSLPYGNYYAPVLFLFGEKHAGTGILEKAWIIFVNRSVFLLEAAGLYVWFARRLSNTEKWIGS